MRHLGFAEAHAILPVPLHHARRRERTYNQAELIARGISQATGIPVLNKALVRTRYTTTQTMLSAAERHTNLRDAFAPGKQSAHIRGKVVMLVDDVLTTGSTLNTCATALLEAGARRVNVAAVAAAARQ